jgi:hypothetical protein
MTVIAPPHTTAGTQETARMKATTGPANTVGLGTPEKAGMRAKVLYM